jgi:hypothetical protein
MKIQIVKQGKKPETTGFSCPFFVDIPPPDGPTKK